MVLALGVASKSPPGVSQVASSKKRCNQVASPSAAGAPPPSLLEASDAPSPQSAKRRWTVTSTAPAVVRDRFRFNSAPVTVASVGTLPVKSKAITARRVLPLLEFPAKMCAPAPLLGGDASA